MGPSPLSCRGAGGIGSMRLWVGVHLLNGFVRLGRVFVGVRLVWLFFLLGIEVRLLRMT